MYRQLCVIFIIYAISQNFISTQDFFKAQLSPSTLTSVPYLDGEVSVYEHIQNRSRLFVTPLAVLYLNQTRVFYNRPIKRYILRLSLILYTNELRTAILKYVSNTRNRCSPPQEICDIKMVPTERLRTVWKRAREFSSDYKLDTSWQSNTALLNKIDVQIECTTNQTCYEYMNDILETPAILNGYELEYSTHAEKQTRKVVTITGQHVMNTKMYSELNQLPSSTDKNSVRYLLVDDMNQLVTEIITKMESEEITDSDYIAHDDQQILTELLRQRLSSNTEILYSHMERQWNSVYWNSDNIRPDRIVHLLNDELKQLQNKTNLTHQNQSFIHQQQNQQRIDQERSHNGYDNSENVFSSTRNKTDRLSDGAGSNSTGQKVVNQDSSDRSQANAFGQSQSDSHHTERSSSYGGSASAKFLGIGASGSYSQSKTNIDAGSKARSHYGSNEWRNALSTYNDRSYDNSHGWKDTKATGDDLSSHNESAWRRAANQDRQTERDHSKSGEDAESFHELRHKNFDFYTNNRQFIEFTGEKFIVKPVKAYKLNLATFQENTKFVHKSIVVSHIDLIHAVPIRIMSSPSSDVLLTTVPVTDNYTNVFESKLHELNEKLTLTELAVAHAKAFTTIVDNNVKNLKLHTTSQLTELKSSITATDNDVGKLKLQTTNTTSQLTELKSSVTTIENNVKKSQTETIKPDALFTGEIRLYASDAIRPPFNWLLCNGSAVPILKYARLFAVIGTTYGAGDYLTTFNLPDLQGRFPMGRDANSNRTRYATELGAKGGQSTHTLTTNHLPSHHHGYGSLTVATTGSHSHTIYDPGHTHTAEIREDGGTSEAGYHVNTVNGAHKFWSNRVRIESAKTDIYIFRDGDHTHALTGTTASTGNGEQYSILNPFQIFDYYIYAGF